MFLSTGAPSNDNHKVTFVPNAHRNLHHSEKHVENDGSSAQLHHNPLKIQAFHWLASSGQSVAHSQVSDKASPLRHDSDFLEVEFLKLRRRWIESEPTVVFPKTMKTTCPGENLASYLCFSLVTETGSDNVDATEFQLFAGSVCPSICLQQLTTKRSSANSTHDPPGT